MSNTHRSPSRRDEPTGAQRLARRLRRGARRLTPRLAARPTRVRVLGALVGLVLLVGGGLTWLVVGLFSVASAAGGWLPAAVWLLPGLLTLSVGVGIGRRWWSSVAGAVAVALLLGTWMYQTAPPDAERLRAVAVEVGAPMGWRRISDEASGNTWCLWNDCPELRYVYATPDPAERVAAEFTARLEADGWHRDEAWDRVRPEDPVSYQVWHHGRWQVTLDILRVGSRGRVYDTTVRPDLTEVDVVYE